MIDNNDFKVSQEYTWFRGLVTFGLNTVILEQYNRSFTGKMKRIIPIAHISSVERNSGINWGGLISGLFLIFISNELIAQEYYKAFVICFLLGTSLLRQLFTTNLTITLTSGEEITIRFWSRHKAKAAEIEDTIYLMMTEIYDD